MLDETWMVCAVATLAETASSEWRTSLIDVGGNNRLLYFRATKGMIDLAEADPGARARLLRGAEIRVNDLFSEYAAAEAARKACELIGRREQEAAEEYGISIAYAAAGFASWSPEALDPAAGEEGAVRRPASRPNAPVLLRPLKLTSSGGAQKIWTIQLVDEFELNGVLGHVLEHGGVQIDGVLQDEELVDEASLDGVYKRVSMLANQWDDFSIEHSLILGSFTYTKQPMVDDVSDLAAIQGSALAMALAGDPIAAKQVRAHSDGVSEDYPDRTPIEDEFLVLDADASQSFVVNAALAGRNLVVQGPPGTGKSQTIANIIATAMARDRSVLFVAQKRAAVSAVLDRLEGADLSHLVLDLFDAQRSRGFVALRLQEAMTRHSAAGLPRVAELHQALTRSRSRLTEHHAAMHSTARGWGVTVAELLAMAMSIPAHVQSTHVEPAATFSAWDEGALSRLVNSADELQRLGALRSDWNDRAGWSPSGLSTLEAAREAGQRLDEIRLHKMTTAMNAINSVAAELSLPAPGSWQELDVLARQFDESDRLRATHPALVDPSIGTRTIRAALSKFERGAPRREVTASERRAALRSLKVSLRAIERRQRGESLRAALVLRDGWVGAPTYRAPDQWIEAQALSEQLWQSLAVLQPLLQRVALNELSFEELEARLAALAEDSDRSRYPRATELAADFSAAGATRILEVLRREASPASSAGDLVRRIAVQSLLRDALAYDAALAGVDGASLTAAVEEFRTSDVSHLEANAVRIRRVVAERLRHALDAHPEQQMRITKEANRKTRFTPVRSLFAQNREVMLAAQPVWAMSPLQVSRLLPAAACFDLVIFDEASQVKPGDAIPALLRAPQAVIAGDSRQLPPTEFFSKVIDLGDEIDEEPDADLTHTDTGAPAPVASARLGSFTRDAESVLIAMDSLLAGQSRTLQWHYRSRDERLIAVSNEGIYGGSLTTFPAADTPDAVSHVQVPPSPGIGTTTNSPEAEVAVVVDLVRTHMKERPKESLGVISFGQKHQDRIEAALARARQTDSEFDRALQQKRDEPFFVKNVERVQGDERDAIILTVGYGKDPISGRLKMFWGPLLRPGGERRLNVAISRAKKRMTLVSSFGPEDLAVDAHPSPGYKLIYQFVRFMSSGGKELARVAHVSMNAFEQDIHDRLIARGLALDPQFGVGSYRLDFAVRHPNQPGRHVLAIEADGASYHSGHIARERDRLRQAQLERRGWRFHRIWSTDWFNNAGFQVERVLDAYARALEDENSATEEHQAERPVNGMQWEEAVGTRRQPRPRYAMRSTIGEYPSSVIVDMVRYVRSDEVVRSSADELMLVLQELGFERRGPRIVAAIQAAQRLA